MALVKGESAIAQAQQKTPPGQRGRDGTLLCLDFAGRFRLLPFFQSFQRPFQLLEVGKDAEPALRIGMGERINRRRCRGLRFRRRPGREVEERFGRFLWQMVGDLEQGIFVGAPHRVEPFGRHAIAEQCVIGDAGEQQRLCRGRRGCR